MIKAAVLGSPIGHSLSPILHKTAYRELSLEGEYEAIEVKSGQLQKFIESVGQEWSGFSLTMPLKEEVLSIASTADFLAKQINSANTLIQVNGMWAASTTDVNGFIEALKAHGVHGVSRVLILGSGATARAVGAGCATFASEIMVLHRSTSREAAMRSAVSGKNIEFLPWNATIPSADLVINTTPAGVADEFVGRFPVNFAGVYFEALYNPWPTKLLQNFRDRGANSVDGLDFLIHQGIDQVTLMSGVNINRGDLAPVLRKACLAVLEGRK